MGAGQKSFPGGARRPIPAPRTDEAPKQKETKEKSNSAVLLLRQFRKQAYRTKVALGTNPFLGAQDGPFRRLGQMKPKQKKKQRRKATRRCYCCVSLGNRPIVRKWRWAKILSWGRKTARSGASDR